MFSKEDDKLKILENHLSNDQFILVHLNPQLEGVEVPEHFKEFSKLTLKFSYHFVGATHISEEGISAELLFGSENYTCFVPMEAIWGATTSSEENYIWPKSIQPETYSELNKTIQQVKTDKGKPKLALKTSQKSNKESKPEQADKKPNLKLVK